MASDNAAVRDARIAVTAPSRRQTPPGDGRSRPQCSIRSVLDLSGVSGPVTLEAGLPLPGVRPAVALFILADVVFIGFTQASFASMTPLKPRTRTTFVDLLDRSCPAS